MRYMIKEKFWSWGNDFWIRDENEENAYFVDGQAFSWGDKLSVQDTADQEVAFISQTMFSWMPRYEIYRNGVQFAEVVKEFSWFKCKFRLDVPGPNDYTINGSFWDHEYVFERLGQDVAVVSKKFWSWTDTYGVDVIAGEDDVAILSTCIVIDLVCHDGND